MKKLIFGVCFIFIFSFLVFSIQGDNNLREESGVNEFNSDDCTDGWRITGYFTPIETDYDSTEMREIEIAEAGKIKFSAQFLDVVFDENKGYGEGWGKTRFGWYLGNYDGEWHKSDAPLDAHNRALKPNSVAVDNSFIPNNSILKISGLPEEYADKSFIANDVGVTVHGKHIDVYTGEGKDAEQKMYEVTTDDGSTATVCVEKQ